MSGIKHLILLSTDTNGNPSHAMGTSKYCRMDMRLALANSIQFAKEYMAHQNSFQNIYVGFELFACAEISSCIEGKGVYRYVSEELLAQSKQISNLERGAEESLHIDEVPAYQDVPYTAKGVYEYMNNSPALSVAQLLSIRDICNKLLEDGIVIFREDLF